MPDDSDLHNAWTMDNSTTASNPGRVKFNKFCWLVHKPLWPITWAGFLILAGSLAILIHWAFWIAAGFLLLVNLLYWVRIKEQYYSGCTNPAVVVGVQPTLIAVSTDLTQGIGRYPAIKILMISLRFLDRRPVEMGMRLATVAGYVRSMNPNLPRWEDFDPHPVQFATFDQAAIDRVLASISSEDWLDLEDGLKQVPMPYRPGLYMVKPR